MTQGQDFNDLRVMAYYRRQMDMTTPPVEEPIGDLIEIVHDFKMAEWSVADDEREMDMAGIRAKAAAVDLAVRHGRMDPPRLSSAYAPICDSLGGIPDAAH